MNDNLLRLALGGITVEVRVSAAEWLEALQARYRLFASDGTPGWVVSLQADPGLERADPPWASHEETVTTFHVGYSRGEIDLVSHAAEVFAPSAQHVAAAADRVLSFICTYDLPRRHQGLLLHGAAMMRRGQGLALSGRSGAGKTTASRMAAGHAQVLTDENLILSLAGPRPMLLSTPFWGASTPPEMIHRVNVQAPLRALLLLEHGPEFRLERLSDGDAVLALLTTEKLAVERVSSAAAWLAIAQRLVAATPTYRLYSRPTAELWPFLDRELGL
ncbi:MAG: hypothetical protein R2844_10685 [Caldilineales bacterium]